MQKRMRHIDIAKGIAMICIILGHLGVGAINQVVFTFHVPIFFLITGYFVSDKGTNKEFVIKKFNSLIIPYILACVAICLISIPRNMLTGNNWSEELLTWIYASIYGSGNSYESPFYIPQIGAIWFLLATFWATIILKWLLGKHRNTRIIVVLAIFIISVISAQYIWLPFSIQAGGVAVLYVYLGYIYKNIQDKIIKLDIKLKIFGIVLMVAVWLWCIINFKGFYIVKCALGNGVVDIIGSICASAIVVLLSMCLDKHCDIVSKLLSNVGRYSLLILCVHIVEQNLFPWHIVKAIAPDAIAIIVIAMGKLVFIFTGTYILSKIRVIRTLFGYK